MRITNEVKTDLSQLIEIHLPYWKKYLENDEHFNALTIGLPDKGDEWGYQTGDNSFTGGAYSFPHWAVTSFNLDTTSAELFADVLYEIGQIERYGNESQHIEGALI